MNKPLELPGKPDKMRYWLRFFAITAVLGFVYYVALSKTDLTWRGSSISPWVVMKRLFWESFFNPGVHAKMPVYLSKMAETVFIAYAGTAIAAVLAVPFGFLAARNMSRLSGVGKALLNGIRAFPEILLAIIFVASVGMGPYAGVLAIGINSIGMLGKLYSEVIESIDTHVLEALRASGANRLQVMWYGVLPQVLPEFLSYILYRFEIDVRSSTVLGVVGAGGIGTLLILAARQRNWEEVGMMLVIIIIVVTIIDLVSSRIRKKIV